jgi:acyl carrier protein phosphodiesterase
MNYLAHLFLAGPEHGFIVGGFIADLVKGKALDQYTIEIQNGIKLHRAIDHFTDTHPLMEQIKVQLRPKYRKYSGVIADVLADHYLALQWNRYSAIPLAEFSAEAYSILHLNKQHMPEKAHYLLHYMSLQDWLFNYQYAEGIKRAFKGLAGRAKYESRMEEAYADWIENEILFEQLFEAFLPQVMEYCEGYKKGVEMRH